MVNRRKCFVWCAATVASCLLLTITVQEYEQFWNDENHAPLKAPDPSRPNVTSTTVSSILPSNRSLIDKSWRQVNRLAVEYRSQLATHLDALASRKAAADDPEVIQFARDLIDPVPMTAATGIKRSHEIVKTPQAFEVETITSRRRNGFFVECGALDGERSSNTIWLEKELGWTGLLVEMDPFFYTQLLGKNRRVFSANGCLSPYKYISMLPYRGHESGHGRLEYPGDSMHQQPPLSNSYVPCLPFETLLLAINRTHVDYFSLDVEGAEFDVLNTIPWDRLSISILSVEHIHGRHSKSELAKFMKNKGYVIHKDIHFNQPEKSLYVDDFIFVKNALSD